MSFIKVDPHTVQGLKTFMKHVFIRELSPQDETMVEEVIARGLRPTLTDIERADQREDYGTMLSMPPADRSLYGQWIDASSLAYTWNVLVSNDPVAAQVRAAFFPPGAQTTLMAVAGAMFRISNEHDDDSKQTADIELYLRSNKKRDHDKMREMRGSGKYVDKFWETILRVLTDMHA